MIPRRPAARALARPAADLRWALLALGLLSASGMLAALVGRYEAP